MALPQFDIFEAGFNNLEETINFGKRSIGGDQSLYEICTLAVVRSSDKIMSSDKLKITSYYEVDGPVFFAINNCLRILKNIAQPDQIALHQFEYCLDNIVASPCGKYILICTRNGEVFIHGLSVIVGQSNGSIIDGIQAKSEESIMDAEESVYCELPLLFKEVIDDVHLSDSQECFIGAFAEDFKTYFNFYTVTSKGLVKKISSTTDESGTRFNSEIVFDFKRNFRICKFAYPFVCLEGHELVTLDLRTKYYDADDALGLKNLYAIGPNFLGFDYKGNIFKIDSARCLIFGLNDKLPQLVDYYDDSLILVEGSKKFIVGITKDEPKIQLSSFLDSKLIYDIPLTNPVHLVNMNGVTEEVPFFTEVHKDGTLTEIRLQYVTETDPELRVKKLIQKGLIDKAEQFARTFNVNPEFVAEAKVARIVEKVECTTEEVDELLKILDTITDHSFRMYYCDAVICKTAADTRRVLCHAAFMDINVRDSSENDNNPLLFKKRKFNQKLQRFDTYMQAYREYNPRKWSYFSDCDLIEEVKVFLKQDRAEEAAIIYSRLHRNEISSLANDSIEEITQLLNKCQGYMSFLNIFIPFTLKYNSSALPIMVEWVHDKVYEMEKESDLDFPDCAIKFLNDVSSLINMYIPAKSHLADESREVLSNLLKVLSNIQKLVNNFFIRLPLSGYLSAPHDIVRTLLNLELEPTHLEQLMKEFLYPFMLKCGVDADSLLIEELKGIFIYCEEYWLDTALVLLKFVCRVDKKLEAIKEILEIASKPWSDKVREIAKMTFEHTSTNPLAEEIAELLRDEHVLVVLQKYNINRNQFASDKLFYFHRILYVNRDNCERAKEDIHQLCRDDNDRFQADMLIVKEFIKMGYIENAMALLDKLEPQKMVIVGKELLEYLLFMGMSNITPMKYWKAFSGALRPLWNRLSKHCKEKDNISITYDTAYAVYGIYNDFGIKVDSSILKTSGKEHILELLFQRVTDSLLEEEDISFEQLVRDCKKIASFMRLTLETVLLKFMRFSDNFSLFLKIGNHLLEASQCPELLTLCAVYILKYSKDSISDSGDETFLEVAAVNKSNPDENDLDAVLLAKKLCVRALVYSEKLDQMPILEVLRWIDSCCYLSNIDEQIISHAEVHQMYLPICRTFYFASTFSTVKAILNSYCAFAESLQVENLKYLTYFKTNKKVSLDEFREEIKQFIRNTGELLKQEQHLTVLNMIKVVQLSCLYFSPEIQEEVMKLFHHFTHSSVLPLSIDAILTHKYIDKRLLLNLMLLVEKSNYEDQLSKYLSVYKRQPSKLNVITQVGLTLLIHYRIKHGKKDLLNILNLCKWWFRINDPNIKYESYFTSKPELRLETLIKEEKLTLEHLPEYAADFGLDVQGCYLKYLEIILLNWQPEVEYITEVSGKKNIIIKNSENELLSKCSKVLKKTSDKNGVFKLTEEIWPMINFYYYEVYLVLLTIHMRVSSTGATIPTAYRPLLIFLKKYRRVGSPTRSEIEQWYGTFPSKALIEPLSEFRLPVTSTFLSSDIWNIIKQEVNLDTYKEWFKVTTILKQYLNQQDICTYAINNTLSSGIIDSRCNVWDLSLKYDHLLPKVDECARSISDLERATAAVYTLMCDMPPGADKVQMAELSYKYAKRYLEAKSSDDVEKVYVKVKQRYLNYSAIHILHKYQLANDKYLKLVAQPSDLIWELYNDPRIESFFDNLIIGCPDINRAVEELCILFGLSVKRESFNVLLKLLKSSCPLDLECSRFPQGNDSIELKRACYLCKSHDVKYWQKILIEQGTKSEHDMSFKANVLRCVYYLSDPETIEEMSNMNHEQFVTHLHKVSVIAKMCDLGLKFETVQQLDEQNQKRILKILAKINNPLSIKCIASLCKIYNLDDLKYWEYIVNSAVQFHMLGELRDYLEFLKDRCVSDCIKNAWHLIVSDAFSNLSSSSPSQSQILLLIQTCPFLYELNIEPYIQKCVLSERLDLADILRNVNRKSSVI